MRTKIRILEFRVGHVAHGERLTDGPLKEALSCFTDRGGESEEHTRGAADVVCS